MPKVSNFNLDSAGTQALMNLGERLKFYRLSRDDSIVTMAERLQCSPRTYISLEKGRPTYCIGVLIKALSIIGELGTLDAVAAIKPDALSQNMAKLRRVQGKNPIQPTDEELEF